MTKLVVNLGSGNNTYTPTSQNDDYVITAGDGNNTITLGSGTGSLAIGNGSNTLTLGDGINSINLGGGNNHDRIAFSNTAFDLGIDDGKGTSSFQRILPHLFTCSRRTRMARLRRQPTDLPTTRPPAR